MDTGISAVDLRYFSSSFISSVYFFSINIFPSETGDGGIWIYR